MSPRIPFGVKAALLAAAAAGAAALSLELSSALLFAVLHGSPSGATPFSAIRYAAYCTLGNC